MITGYTHIIVWQKCIVIIKTSCFIKLDKVKNKDCYSETTCRNLNSMC